MARKLNIMTIQTYLEFITNLSLISTLLLLIKAWRSKSLFLLLIIGLLVAISACAQIITGYLIDEGLLKQASNPFIFFIHFCLFIFLLFYFLIKKTSKFSSK